MKSKSLSLILPVYDDQSEIKKVIEEIQRKFEDLGFNDYELLIFLDSRVAATTERMLEDVHGEDARIRVFDGERYQKIGTIFAEGIQKSQKDCVGIWSAYNQISVDSFDLILSGLEAADVVAAYIKNSQARQWYRTILSKLNVFMLNFFFGLNLRYYHLAFFKTEHVRRVKIKSNGHSAMGEPLIWLIKSGASFVQVPFIMVPHCFPSKSRAFDLHNIIDCVFAYFSLFLSIRSLGKRMKL